MLKDDVEQTILLPRYHYMIGRNSLTEINSPGRNFLNPFRKRAMEMTVFNAPKGGETIILRNKKKAILIDGGEDHINENTKLGKDILKFLKGKAKLQAIVLSHNHQDHSNAIGSVLDGDGTVLGNKINFYHQAEDRTSDFFTKMMQKINNDHRITKIPIHPWKQKSIANWNGSQSIRLFCGPKVSGKYKRFYRSILMRVPFGNARFLFTGDIERSPTENKLRIGKRTKHFLKNIDVLKITHHGSHTGTSAKFLDHTSPKLFVTSSAKDKKHDLSPETEKRIENYIKRNDDKFDVPYYTIFNTYWERKIIVRTDGKKSTLDGVNGILFEVETDQ